MFCGKSHGQTPERAKKLLRYVQANNVAYINKLLLIDPKLLTFEYPSHDYQNILMIACNDYHGTDTVTSTTIDTLIKFGASCTTPSKSEGWECLHYTALHANFKKMDAIIKTLSNDQLNSLVYCSKRILQKYVTHSVPEIVKTCSNNALHVLLKCNNQNGQFFECRELLLRSGIKVNQSDSNGVSPRDLMNDCKIESYISEIDNERKLFDLENVEDLDGTNERLSSCTMLQLCCLKGLPRCVQHLLNRGADPNRTIAKNTKAPIMLAIKQDHEEVVQLILDNKQLKLPQSVLVKLQMKYRHIKNFAKADKYMDMILGKLQSRQYTEDETRQYVDYKDDLHRTALHYATHYRCTNNILKLLRLGASLTQKDLFGHTPMDTMEPQVLELFLDSCVNIPKTEEELNSMLYSLHNKRHKFSVEIHYGCLINRGNQESEFLLQLVKLPNMSHLLNHPVVASYLALKWQKFKWVVYANLLLYFIAYVSLLFYGFASTSFAVVSNTFLLSSLALLTLQQTVQVLIFRTHVIRRLDNIFDLLLIAGIIYILAAGWIGNGNLLSAFSFVFLTSTFGIFMQLGHLPIFTIKVAMFTQISINFFKYTLFYMFPLLAFVFCFYKLCDDEENQFFGRLYDTFIMFATDSDRDYPNQFKTHPVFSHVVFVVFIVLIGVILHNLLIALAVNDLRVIQQEAEFVGKKEKVRYITNIERRIFKIRQNKLYFKMMSKKLVRFCEVFCGDKEPILVVQPYNDGCVFLAGKEHSKQYMNDQKIIDHLERIYKNATLQNQDSQETTIITLHKRLERLENLLQTLQKTLNVNYKSS